MKKISSIILVAGLITSLLSNSAFAGGRHDEDFNPAWIPVAILATVAAVATINQPPAVYERRVYHEPRHTVIYREPHHYKPDHHIDRRPTNDQYRCNRNHGERRYMHHR